MGERYASSGAIPHTGRGRTVAALLGALIALAVLSWAVVAGFRGRHIGRNAAAITAPLTPAPNAGAPPSRAVPAPAR
jgi:hypothetical protein